MWVYRELVDKQENISDSAINKSNKVNKLHKKTRLSNPEIQKTSIMPIFKSLQG